MEYHIFHFNFNRDLSRSGNTVMFSNVSLFFIQLRAKCTTWSLSMLLVWLTLFFSLLYVYKIPLDTFGFIAISPKILMRSVDRNYWKRKKKKQIYKMKQQPNFSHKNKMKISNLIKAMYRPIRFEFQWQQR